MSETSVYERQLRKKVKTGIPRLMQIAGTKRVYLIFAGILSVLAVIFQMTPYVTIYLFIKSLVANIGNLGGLDAGSVGRLGWLTLAGIGGYGLVTYAAGMLSHTAAFNILYEIRIALASKLARLPMGYFTSKANGSIKKVLAEDVERIELFVAHHINDLTQAVVLPILSLVFLFIMDWRLALGVLIPLPLAMAASPSNSSGVQKRSIA